MEFEINGELLIYMDNMDNVNTIAVMKTDKIVELIVILSIPQKSTRLSQITK
jgi:hypothetical protein